MGFKRHIPNILTGLRLALIPVFVLLFFQVSPIWALGVFVLACWTDLLDGWLARKWNVISNFGKLFDPLADKFMQLTALVCLVIRGWLPLWCLCFLLAKESLMVVGGWFFLKKYRFVVSSNLLGKVASVVIDVAVGALFLTPILSPWDLILLYVGMVLTVLAMVNYSITNFRKVKHENQDPDGPAPDDRPADPAAPRS
ncbi:MAG: CDP-diacylglycerol--glycerol-3-phosphate 3-phosphatidyltransferase [Eubacteriales bacterium]|nr:CDP-diacylglycerol--glycerol-3-phosphate 3-phosphatidyltransferase [Eubacteriales bacterium]